MVLFLLALVVTAAVVGVYAYYNPGLEDVTLRTYHVTGADHWMLVAAGAVVPLFFFFLYWIVTKFRMRRLRREAGRSLFEQPSDMPPIEVPPPASAPRRSWGTSRD